MDEIADANTLPTEEEPQPVPQTPEEAEEEENEAILELATERFKQAYEAHRDDFESCGDVQTFISLDQWPENIKSERNTSDRPCLTLDHLNQYVRHVVNSGLMQSRDVRVLSMSGEADDKVGEILAGMIRQITQTSTSKVAYETGLRHGCQVGFGYWRVKVIPILKSATAEDPEGLSEITIRKIKDPRMVLLDPFCEYPDGRDAHYGFVLSKLTNTEFKTQYKGNEDAGSWHELDTNSTLPWIGAGTKVVAEYYYRDSEGTMKWAILCPNKVLDKGIHHGDVMPIVRTVGEEFEVGGKERKRGMINGSSMDAQRAYNYSSSAFIEAVALAPLAPFVAADGQIEQFKGEWNEAHRVPRAVLRYKPVSASGQLVPPPQRSEPAGIPAGWQGMMANLISDTQMIMGLANPSVMGTGGAPVQSGAGINAQQAPGEINTFHFHEHWHMAIEQTGRVILAMIPHVYTKAQAVKITGEDGIMKTALINPAQQQTMLEISGAIDKALSISYNPNIGRYDVAITTGPSSASKKMEANKNLMTIVNADPTIMKVAGDLVVGSMDMAGADILARRLKSLLPPGITEDESGQLAMLQKAQTENEELKQSMADMEKVIMAEREQSQAKLIAQKIKSQTDLQQQELDNHAALFTQRLDDDNAIKLALIKTQASMETSIQDNIVKIIIERMKNSPDIDAGVVESITASAGQPTHEQRMASYMQALNSLTTIGDSNHMGSLPPSGAPSAAPSIPRPKGWQIIRDEEGNMTQLIPVEYNEVEGNEVEEGAI